MGARLRPKGRLSCTSRKGGLLCGGSPFAFVGVCAMSIDSGIAGNSLYLRVLNVFTASAWGVGVRLKMA